MAAPESTALTIQNTMTAVLKLPTASISIRNVSSKTFIGIVINKALQEAVNEIDQHLEWLMEPERIADFRTRKYAEEQILCLRKNIIGAIKSLLSRGTQFFYIPEVKKAAMEQIKEDSRPSVLQKLQQRQEEINQREQTRTKPKKRSHGMEL